MKKKFFLISEALDAPFDEGIKNIVYSLSKQLKTKNNVTLVTKHGNNTGGIDALKINLNKLFLSNSLNFLLREYKPDIVLYIPMASCSFYSFIRAKILKLMRSQIKVVLLCVQHRKYSLFQRFATRRFLKPDMILLLGKRDEPCFLNMGMKVKVLPPAIDIDRFCPAFGSEERSIRTEFNIPLDKRIVLHVGHIRKSRNLECFFDIQDQDNTQVVIVASSTWGEDVDLRQRLESKGIRIIDGFISDMSRIYKMSDVYVFPVINRTGATDMPLSVLEAMACNLPVISTRYGGLVDFFAEDAGFRYFDTQKELIEIIRDIGNKKEISNYKKIESFTWKRFADEVLSICEMLG